VQRINPAQIWGGNLPANAELCSSVLSVSLFSSGPQVEGNGNICYICVEGQDRWTRLALVDGEGSKAVVGELSRWWFQALSSSMSLENESALLSQFNHLSARLRPGVQSRAAILTFHRSGSFLDFCWSGGMPLLSWRPARGSWKGLGGTLNGNGGGRKMVVRERKNIPLQSGDRFFLCTEGLFQARGDGDLRLIPPILESSVHRKIHLVKRKLLGRLFNGTGETPGPGCGSFLIMEVR
jgi:hypothetical protein